VVGLAFVGVFCAAMFGVRGKVCGEDLDRAMIDAVSLVLSFAPAGHAAILWLSQGPASFAAAVAAGLVGAVVGAIVRKLRLPGHLRVVGLVVSFLATCALALCIQDGYLCLVAWYSACVARAYEIGLRCVLPPRFSLSATHLSRTLCFFFRWRGDMSKNASRLQDRRKSRRRRRRRREEEDTSRRTIHY
jgi:hypothetical protein